VSRRIAVLGPGGVGGLLAALLARAGNDVVCLAGEATTDAIRSHGLRIRSVQYGEFTAAVAADTALRGPVDACFVTVKHASLAAALERVAPAALGDGLLVPLLNGVEHPAELRRRYPPELVAPAAIRVEATKAGPGVIEHTSPFTEVDLASATAKRDRLDDLAATLVTAGVTARVTDDETATLWSKLAFLAPMALLTTRYRATIGELRTDRRDELIAVIGESCAVARAHGAPADPDAMLARFEAFGAGSKSSMLRDAEAGRPLEIDAIGGGLIRAAAAHGIGVPLIRALVADLEQEQA
jgi:2-dehydropantoate 2-reductase